MIRKIWSNKLRRRSHISAYRSITSGRILTNSTKPPYYINLLTHEYLSLYSSHSMWKTVGSDWMNESIISKVYCNLLRSDVSKMSYQANLPHISGFSSSHKVFQKNLGFELSI